MTQKLYKVEQHAFRWMRRLLKTHTMYIQANVYMESLQYAHQSPEWYAFYAGVGKAQNVKS